MVTVRSDGTWQCPHCDVFQKYSPIKVWDDNVSVAECVFCQMSSQMRHPVSGEIRTDIVTDALNRGLD